MIPEGKYKAKAVGGSYTISKEKKTPGVAVKLELEVDGKKEYLHWTGWFSEKTTERTVESLALLGFDEFKAVDKDGTFPATNFDGSEVEAVVEHEAFAGSDGKGKTAAKVKWINKLGGSGFGLAENVTVKDVLKNVDLRRELKIARQKLGLKKSGVKNETPVFDKDDEIPF